ncbi:phosphoacetylglucosamine mutase-like [Culex quinquefasciatus]|uniref:phosphoacetylglucosamine mutase-like n=1 Tax=Culex quinquefasciatus TaxID=7176 RepID=UPI0018E2F3A8|nr:phosphoacetylglucosamine mutase-like [Culex quinquefasciatus]
MMWTQTGSNLYVKKKVLRDGQQLEVEVFYLAYRSADDVEFPADDVEFRVTKQVHPERNSLRCVRPIRCQASTPQSARLRRGHGTVIYNAEAKKRIAAASKDESVTKEQRDAVKLLLSTIDLTNKTVGDAIFDMLVETVLHYRQGGRSERVHDDRCRAHLPEGLQAAINEIVAKYPCGRSFVRPSGIKDVGREYAESETKNGKLQLALEVANIVYDRAGGVDARPELAKI